MSNAKPPSLDQVRAKRPVGPVPVPVPVPVPAPSLAPSPAPDTSAPKITQSIASQTVSAEAPLDEQVSSTTEPQAEPLSAPTQAARWLIEFDLLVTQPLHVGSGTDKLLTPEETKSRQRNGDSDSDAAQRAFYAMLVRDHQGQPSLPGASLKGVLLARLRSMLGEPPAPLPAWAQAVFGRTIPNPRQVEHPNKPGCAEFRRAAWVAGQQDAIGRIETRTAINRSTGTVEPGKLFSSDTVQPNAKFIASIVLQRATSQQVSELHALLAGCTSTDPLHIGANQRAGWGAMVVQSLRVKVLRHEELARWWQCGIQHGTAELPSSGYRTVAAGTLPNPEQTLRPSALLMLPLSLVFDGPFAVRDSEYKKAEAGKHDTQPRKRDGKPLLPATSLLGSLRSRAEYILRTLGKDTPAGHDAPGVRTGELPDDLCSLLFGCTGWRGLVGAVGDFVSLTDERLMGHHMVALCRITGAGQDSAKFEFQCFESPVLVGKLTLDQQRMRHPKLEPAKRNAALGLLHLLLVDLAEGDIGFGMARSKGWGWVARNQAVLQQAACCWWQPLAESCGAPEVAQAGRLVAALHTNVGPVDGTVPAGEAVVGLPAPLRLPGAGTPTAALRPAVNACLPRLCRELGNTGTQFHNPYHFLPFARTPLRGAPQPPIPAKIALPSTSLAKEAQAAHHAHDHAQSDRFSGKLLVGLRTVTPVFVGASRPNEKGNTKPVKVIAFQYDKVRAIPGTSLRGMLSALLEPLSGSAMRVVNAHFQLAPEVSPRVGDPLLLKGTLKVMKVDGQLDFVVVDATNRMWPIKDGAIDRMIAIAAISELPGQQRHAHAEEGQTVFFNLDSQEEWGEVSDIDWSPRDAGGPSIPCTISRLVAMDDPRRLPLGLRPDPRLHAAEWLLGVVEQPAPKYRPARAFASRLSVGIARFHPQPDGAYKPQLADEVILKELANPKPPSPALYLRRKDGASQPVDKPALMANPHDFAFHGTKVYLHAWRNAGAGPAAAVAKPLNAQGIVEAGGSDPWVSHKDGAATHRQVIVQPIKAGQHFTFTIRFQNLTSDELGQLCAAIEPSPAFEHRLGMGRPIGLGSVKLKIQSLAVTDFAHRYRCGQDATTPAPDSSQMAASARLKLQKADPALWTALLMLGEPARVQAPVHYPQLARLGIENKNFKWWVENDKLGAPHRQVLPPL